MQASSDIFLGWVHVDPVRRAARDFYGRQLKDAGRVAAVRGHNRGQPRDYAAAEHGYLAMGVLRASWDRSY